jgi:hypothetical protein
MACYQPAGAGQKARLIRFDPIKFPDLRAVLEKALGPLVRFGLISEAAPEVEAAE